MERVFNAEHGDTTPDTFGAVLGPKINLERRKNRRFKMHVAIHGVLCTNVVYKSGRRKTRPKSTNGVNLYHHGPETSPCIC